MNSPDPPSTIAGLAQRYAETANFSAYLWKDVAIFVWSDAPTVDSLAGYARCCSELIAEHPGGLSAVGFLVPGGRLPTSEVRAELSRITDTLGDHLAGLAIVVLGTGFWASALRGLLTAVHMLLRKAIAMHVFSNSEAAVSWLAERHSERTGTTFEPEELLAVLHSIAAYELSTARAHGRKVA